VLAREDVPGNKRLVAYYTCEPGAQVTVDGLLARLTARLPEYMVPTAYLPLEAMPVTANGKLDRKALPAPDGGAYLSRPYEAPVGEVEDVIARIWSEILGVERVGRHDNFFELGGHSLLAVRMLSTIQRELSVAVPLANVFTCPTLAGFAGGMAVHKTSALEPIVRLEAEQDFPLSFAQQRLWFLAQMEGLSAAYNIPAAMELRGRLDSLALQRALDALVVRHESLRTCFMTIDGDPIQRIASPDTPFPLAFDDLREVHDQADAVAALLDCEASAPFNLSRAPLVRGRLIRCGDERWVLSIVVHHIVSDGWSNTILIRELSALYAGFARGTPASLPTLPIRYVDYAVWQRRWLSNETLSEQAAYWREQLAGAPALLELPTDRQRPAVQAFAGDTVALEIDAQTTAELKSLSRRCGTTLYMTVLAAWAIVLARLSGQQDLVIGTPVANRPRHDLEGMVGFFVNTLALRIDLSGDPSIAMLLERIRATTIAAQEQQSLPFEQIVEIVNPPRSLSYSPIFQVMFSWQNMERAEFSLDEAIIKPLEQSEPFARFDLALDMRESEDVLKGTLNYATALFDTSTAQRFANYLRQILVEVASDSSRGIEALRMLPTEERHRLVVEWNDTVVPYPAERCIHQIFEDRVAEAPDAVALHFEAQSRSYGELNREANRLARHLRSLGVRPGLRVAICVERSFEMYIGLLAIVKAGGAYVPMEPSYPVERLAFMLEDADPMVVLTHQVARPLIEAAHAMAANAKMPIIDLLGDAMDWASADDSDLPIAEVGLDGRCVAYMIYTSGSTGRPKGAMIEHHSLINRLLWMRNAYGLGQEDIAIQKTPFTFDVSVWEIFGTLIHGAPLVVARPEGHRDPDYLVDLIQAHGAATIHFVPSMLQLFLENKRARTCISLRNVFCSGEELPSTLARRFVAAFEEAALHNLYGPTEATIDVTAWSCPRPFVEGQAVPIGRPIDNTFAYILDGHNEPAAIGVVGELCIGGVGVARGYFNRPELTAERFVANPFLAGDRLYRTGDLARFRADGNIEFVGRNDFQVKLRGLRIELGEIEAQLGTCPGVREAVVLVREDVPGDRRLVAYYAADSDVVASSLAAELATRLPDYMVPSAYVRVDAMPVTSNGKLDRKSLPAPDAAPLTDRAYESPVGPTETAIAAIWSEVLGVREVGRHDHFFELGGHSLLAIRVIEQLRGKGVRANVLNLFRTPVLSQLATTLTSGAEDMSFVPGPIAEGTERITPDILPLVKLTQDEIDRIVQGVPGGARNLQDVYPLTHLQEGLLFHHMMERESDPYLMWNLMRFRDRAALDAYAVALSTVISRHDALRTGIVWEGLSEPVQVVWREAPLHVETIDVGDGHGEFEERMVACIDPRRKRLDLGQAPLIRLYAARDVATGEWLAMRLVHHVIDDVTTAQLLDHEILAHIQGREAELPFPLPFKLAVMRARRAGDAESQERFFRSMLADVEEPTTPFGLRDVHGDGTSVSEARIRLPSALSSCIRQQARRLGVNAASMLHVAWGQVIARASGRTDAVFGTVLFGRLASGESADRIFGPFINTLPLLVPADDTGAAEGVRETHRRLTELIGHEQASLALAQRCALLPPQAPLFTAILNYRHGIDATPDDRDHALLDQIQEIRSEERTNYPLVLNVDDLGDDFLLAVQSTAGVDPALVCAMLQTALTSLTEALAVSPTRPLGGLDVLPPDERRRMVVDWNDTAAPYSEHLCLHEPFERSAARTPDAPALRFEEQVLSYAELNRQA
ncbi:non-ribosomal peptide synthetase, partial [Xanthomonas sp. D-109]|uniref:amino acid adenylation domain-containing protein n=1 Tax=Xanthomonas sp. D-109 TaxID=2821274 RepID=UPI001ADC75BB